MTRILFTTMPLAGHLRPGLPIAQQLVADGHEVAWYSGANYEHLVRRVGAQVFRMSAEADVDDNGLDEKVNRGKKPSLGTLKRAIMDVFIAPIPLWVQEIDAIIDEFRPDVVVAEQGFMAGPIAGERRGIRSVVFNTSPLGISSVDAAPFGTGLLPSSSALGRLRNRSLNWAIRSVVFAEAQRAAEQMRERLGLPPIDAYFMDWGVEIADRYLVPTVPAFEYPRSDLPENVEFVGPFLPEGVDDWTPPEWWADVLAARAAGRPVVLVTQGTIATDPRNLLLPAIEGLADSDALVIVTTVGFDADEVTPAGAAPGQRAADRLRAVHRAAAADRSDDHQRRLRRGPAGAGQRRPAGRRRAHRGQDGGLRAGDLVGHRRRAEDRHPVLAAGAAGGGHRSRERRLPHAGAAAAERLRASTREPPGRPSRSWRWRGGRPGRLIGARSAGRRPSDGGRLQPCSAAGAGGDVRRDPLRVPARAADQHRREGGLEQQPDVVQTGRVLDDAAVAPGIAVVAGDVRPHQAELLPEAGAPDDVGDVEHGAVVEDRAAVVDADRAGLGRGARRRPRGRRGGPAAGGRRRAGSPAASGGRSACGPSGRGWPGTTAPGTASRIRREPNGTGDLGHRPARQPGLVTCPHALQRDVRARLAGADDQHGSGEQLAGVCVAGRVQLADARGRARRRSRAPGADAPRRRRRRRRQRRRRRPTS